MNDRECDEIKKRIDKLEAEAGSINRSVTALEIAVARTDEQTKTLFSLLGEIKESVETIVKEMREIRERPDPFKETVYGYSLKVLEKALIGGVIAYVVFKVGI